jgi:hypothetical protein
VAPQRTLPAALHGLQSRFSQIGQSIMPIYPTIVPIDQYPSPIIVTKQAIDNWTYKFSQDTRQSIPLFSQIDQMRPNQFPLCPFLNYDDVTTTLAPCPISDPKLRQDYSLHGSLLIDNPLTCFQSIHTYQFIPCPE